MRASLLICWKVLHQHFPQHEKKKIESFKVIYIPQAVGRELLQRQHEEMGKTEGRRQQAIILHVRAGPHLQGVRRDHELPQGGDRRSAQEDWRHSQARGR